MHSTMQQEVPSGRDSPAGRDSAPASTSGRTPLTRTLESLAWVGLAGGVLWYGNGRCVAQHVLSLYS
jgi:hypothetical protein